MTFLDSLGLTVSLLGLLWLRPRLVRWITTPWHDTAPSLEEPTWEDLRGEFPEITSNEWTTWYNEHRSRRARAIKSRGQRSR